MMEDSTSYTLQEIEKLKLKISGYRNTLMTLKKGTSFEDLQLMKREFEELKLQLSYIEGLTKTMEEKQHLQNEFYEEQVQQLSLQIAKLNKTVEEMGQEIVSISNQLIAGKSEELPPKVPVAPSYTNQGNSNGKVTYTTISPAEKEQPAVSSEPSYMQLRNLTKQAIQLQKEEETRAPAEQSHDTVSRRDQRFFNQRHFQNLSHPHTNGQQGRYNNPLGPTPFQFKTTTKNEDNQGNADGKGFTVPNHAESVEKNTSSADLYKEEDVTSSTAGSNEQASEDMLLSSESEAQIEERIIVEVQNVEPETENEQANLEEQKNRRQKNPSFFNIFRK